MTDDKEKRLLETGPARCDVKVWCASCQRSEFTTSSDKYLCTACGQIMALDHEVHHEHFPHISGDKDNLS